MGWTLFAICCSLPLLLALLPATGWAVRNHLRIAFTLESRDYADFPEPKPTPIFYAFPPLPDSADPDRHLAFLVDPNKENSGLDALLDAAKKGAPNAHLCAAYINAALAHARPPDRRDFAYDKPGDREKRKRQADEAVVKHRPTWLQIIEVAKRGREAEPNNVLFPLVIARIFLALHDQTHALEALRQAAKCTDYRDYVGDSQSILTHAQEREFGYRGFWARTYSGTAISNFPSTFGTFATEVRDANDKQAAIDLVAVCRTIYQRAEDPMQMQMTRRLLLGVLPPGGPIRPKNDEERRAQYRAQAAQMSYVPGLPKLVAEVDSSMHWDRILTARENDAEERSLWLRLTAPYTSEGYSSQGAALLTAGVSLCVFALLYRLIGLIKWEGPPPAILPAVAASAWSIIDHFTVSGWSGTSMILPVGIAYALVAAGCWFPRYRGIFIVGGFFVPLVAMLLHMDELTQNGGPYEGVALIIYSVLAARYLWRKRKGSGAKGWLIPAILLASTGLLTGQSLDAGFGFGELSLYMYMGSLFLFAILIASAWQSVSLPEAGRQLSRPLPLCIALCCLAYSCFAILDVASNARAEEQDRSYKHFAQDARAWARDNYDKPIPPSSY